MVGEFGDFVVCYVFDVVQLDDGMCFGFEFGESVFEVEMFVFCVVLVYQFEWQWICLVQVFVMNVYQCFVCCDFVDLVLQRVVVVIVWQVFCNFQKSFLEDFFGVFGVIEDVQSEFVDVLFEGVIECFESGQIIVLCVFENVGFV